MTIPSPSHSHSPCLADLLTHTSRPELEQSVEEVRDGVEDLVWLFKVGTIWRVFTDYFNRVYFGKSDKMKR